MQTSHPESGGGVYVFAAAPLIQNNVITANRTITTDYDGGQGGGIFVGGNGRAAIAQNDILSNTAGYGGGVYHNGGMTVTITANAINGNAAANRGGGTISPLIDYNDVWSHTMANYDLPGSVVTGPHNISHDPLFANPAAGDYHLQVDSPAVDAGAEPRYRRRCQTRPGRGRHRR